MIQSHKQENFYTHYFDFVTSELTLDEVLVKIQESGVTHYFIRSDQFANYKDGRVVQRIYLK